MNRNLQCLETPADEDRVTQHFCDALGESAVDVRPASLDAAATATFATEARIRGILRPRSREEVQRCVRIARAEAVPLYPISGGKNWGLGSRVPTTDGAYLLDLGGMARILDYDAELAHVTIEPGVSFGQLATFLRERGERHLLSTTGSTPASSVIGNTVERGDGIGPLGDRAAHVCALEVVLGTGEVIETGFARFSGASAARAYRWGVGPSLDSLFQQSNLGIVTRMTVWLTPRPAALLAFRFAVGDASQLGSAMEAIRQLRLEGTLRSLVAVWNDFRVLSTRVNIPWGDASPRAILREELAALVGGEVAPWYGMGAVYAGSPALAEAARLRIAEVLGPHTADLIFEEQRRGASTIVHTANDGRSLAAFGSGDAAFALLGGQPQEASLASAYFRKEVLPPAGDRDLDRDRCGVMWSCPVVPLRATDIERAAAICETSMTDHGFEPMLALLAQHDRTAYLVPIIIYDRDVPGDDTRARTCHDACLAALIDAGYLPYRLGVQSMGALPQPNDDSVALFGRLKHAFDPDEILAPGRYDPRRARGDDAIGGGEPASTSNPNILDGTVLGAPELAGEDCLFYAFRPALHPELADQVEAAHREVLAEYCVEGLTIRTPLRTQQATWMVVARTQPGAPPCGAVRLELPTPQTPTPLETIVADHFPHQLRDLCAALHGSAEIAGLWVARDHRRRGLSRALMLAGIHLAKRLQLAQLYGIAAGHVIPTFVQTGACIERRFSGEGPLPYPSTRYQSHLLRWDLSPCRRDAAVRTSPRLVPFSRY